MCAVCEYKILKYWTVAKLLAGIFPFFKIFTKWYKQHHIFSYKNISLQTPSYEMYSPPLVLGYGVKPCGHASNNPCWLYNGLDIGRVTSSYHCSFI